MNSCDVASTILPLRICIFRLFCSIYIMCQNAIKTLEWLKLLTAILVVCLVHNCWDTRIFAQNSCESQTTHVHMRAQAFIYTHTHTHAHFSQEAQTHSQFSYTHTHTQKQTDTHSCQHIHTSHCSHNHKHSHS